MADHMVTPLIIAALRDLNGGSSLAGGDVPPINIETLM
jgi:hypothetical protein